MKSFRGTSVQDSHLLHTLLAASLRVLFEGAGSLEHLPLVHIAGSDDPLAYSDHDYTQRA
jgi:hypothetical protein